MGAEDNMSFKQFIKEINGNRVEGELVHTFLYSLITGVLLFLVLFMFNRNAVSQYSIYIVLGIITYSLLTLTLRQVRAYKQFNCMTGMMIGMTAGMIAGFLPGYYVGATNGMFVGGVFGMTVGILFGIWNGKCCGIMGIMEGTMAGFMGGWMGAMTSVMLLNDHLILATIIVSVISWILMGMLNYMIYFEMNGNERQHHESHGIGIVFTAILTILTELIMVFGSRSALFG